MKYSIGPPLPPIIQITTTAEAMEICFSAFSFYPVSYKFNATDIMGDVLSQTSTNECIILETLACSPYNISAMAYNKVGGSNTTWNDTNVKEGII